VSFLLLLSSLSWPWSHRLRSPLFAPYPGCPLHPWPLLAPVAPVVPAVVVLMVLTVPIALELVVLMPGPGVILSSDHCPHSWWWLSSLSSWCTVAIVAVSPSSWLGVVLVIPIVSAVTVCVGVIVLVVLVLYTVGVVISVTWPCSFILLLLSF
jgi:hypothetical protein